MTAGQASPGPPQTGCALGVDEATHLLHLGQSAIPPALHPSINPLFNQARKFIEIKNLLYKNDLAKKAAL